MTKTETKAITKAKSLSAGTSAHETKVVGLDKLTFDGYSLSWHGRRPSRYKGFSGQADESANEADKDLGPIPQGMYTIDPENIEEMDTSDEDTARDWGSKRVTLEPWKATRERILNCLDVDRKGFYIHGGSDKGTTGCIEITSEAEHEAFFQKLKRYGQKIDVQVMYVGEREGKYEKESCPYPDKLAINALSSLTTGVHNAEKIIAECAIAFENNSEDCNKYLKAVAAPFFEPDLFSGPAMNADAIISEISSSALWDNLEKSIPEAIAAAKSGKFVIAGMLSSEMNAQHGHLAVVVGVKGEVSGTVVVPICYAGSLSPSARVQKKRISATFRASDARNSKISYFARLPETVPNDSSVSRLVDHIRGIRGES